MPSGKNSDKALERRLGRLSRGMMRKLGVRRATLDIFLLPDAAMARLKARFIKKKTEPNVLSFPEPVHFPHPEVRGRYLGEIYLNKGILHKNPGRAAPLLLHGMLHLLGHDHRRKADALKMERLEKKILGGRL